MHQQGCKQDMASADLGRPNPKSLKLSVVPDLVRYYALSFPKHPPGSQKPLVTVIRENLVLSLRYRSRDTGRANSERKSPLHPTGLSGIERPQPFCWKIDVWGSPRTSSCLPQTLIPWVLEKSLDRGKYKQRKTSGDCSQQLHFGTVSQTAASVLQGRYLLGSLLARGNQMGANISRLHWLLGDGSRNKGQWDRLAARPGFGEGEDTNTRLWLWSESSKGHELSPNSHHLLMLWVPGQRAQTTATASPQEPWGWQGATSHPCVLPRARCWQWRDGRMEQGILTPCPNPSSAYQCIIMEWQTWCQQMGSNCVWPKWKLMEMEQLSVANWHPLTTGRKGTRLIFVCYCFYKKHLLTIAGRVMSVSTGFSYLFCSLPYKIIHTHDNSFYLDFFFSIERSTWPCWKDRMAVFVKNVCWGKWIMKVESQLLKAR